MFDIETGLICGIAFQGNKAGEALGYLIPPDVIRHFFRDIEDGVVNGFGDFLFGVECLENEAARRYCGMSDAKVRAATSDVMSAYQIPADRSADLRRRTEFDGYLGAVRTKE